MDNTLLPLKKILYRLNSCAFGCEKIPVEWLSDVIKYTQRTGKYECYLNLFKCSRCGNVYRRLAK